MLHINRAHLLFSGERMDLLLTEEVELYLIDVDHVVTIDARPDVPV